jgi:hypothetical protein
VYRVEGGTPSVVLDGFTTIVDLAFGRDSLYVLQISAGGLLVEEPPVGKLIRVARDGTRTELAAGQLTQPTGLAVSRKGEVYVANHGGSPTAGEIVRSHDDDDDHDHGHGHGHG